MSQSRSELYSADWGHGISKNKVKVREICTLQIGVMRYLWRVGTWHVRVKVRDVFWQVEAEVRAIVCGVSALG